MVIKRGTWLDRGRAWQWAVALHALTLVLFLLHIATGEGRGLLAPQYVWATVPLLLVLAIGTVVAFAGRSWGLGMAIGADVWLVAAAALLHVYAAARSTLPDYRSGFTADAPGYLALSLSVLLLVSILGGLATGLRALQRTRAARLPTGAPTRSA